ncbi:MFS transporter [Lysinibacillus xylanilyticus]|uniref:MFS transporter n=1 Tax=Lysinibacillus xylanilyticus TaxID=582475 RepID=UPI003D01C238
MKKYSKSFKALWIGEIVSELGSAAGGITNGLLLYEITGSKEWMGILWLVYFIPSLILQSVTAPFLNHVEKGKMIRNIQLIRSSAYLLPLIGFVIDKNIGTIIGLIALQFILGLMQPIYASLSFSLLPEVCEKKDLTEANGLLDGTIRLMSFLAPGITSLLLLAVHMQFIYMFSCIMFGISYISLCQMSSSSKQTVPVWTKKLWWGEMKEGYRTFFKYKYLLRLTFLSSTVQFAVGATTVLSIPFIRSDLNGESWEYGIFAGAFPIGYVIGMLLLKKIPKTYVTMHLGLIGGGLSFVFLFFVKSIPAAWMCELIGGVLFPLFNSQSAAIFQSQAPKERLAQLSAVRLLFLRVTMPIGIVFASTSFFDLSTRQAYGIVGLAIVLPGLFYLFFFKTINNILESE